MVERTQVDGQAKALETGMHHPKERQREALQGKWDKHPTRPAARVDDFLIKQHELRYRVENLLEALLPGRKPSIRLMRALCQEAVADGTASLKIFLELYLAETVRRRARLLRTVLEAVPASQLHSAIRNFTASHTLTASQLQELEELAFIASARSESASHVRQRPPSRVYFTPAELLENFLQNIEKLQATEPEVVGVIWLHGFKQLPVESRIGLLNALAQRPDPLFVSILELEAANPSAEIRRAVAAILPRFQCQESLEVAKRMRLDHDVVVRYDAGRAEIALQNCTRLPRAAEPPVFSHAFCIGLPCVGFVGVLYAVRDPRNCIKFCSVLIDTWHRGIVDTWGNVNCSESQFSEVLLAFAGRMAETALVSTSAEPEFQSISRSEALELICSGARLSEKRGRKLPAEFPLWARLFSHDQCDSSEEDSASCPSIVDNFAFDLHCACCARPIAANRKRTNLAVSGGQAFCKRCLNRQRRCVGCGSEYRLAVLSARRLASSATHARCQNCVKTL